MASSIQKRAAALKLKYRAEALKAAISNTSAEEEIAETAALNRAAAAATAAKSSSTTASTGTIDAITSAQPASSGSSAAAQAAAALSALQSGVSSRNSALATGSTTGTRTGATGTAADAQTVSSKAKATALEEAELAAALQKAASTEGEEESNTISLPTTKTQATRDATTSEFVDALETVSGLSAARRALTTAGSSAAEQTASALANLRNRTATRGTLQSSGNTGIGARTGATGTAADTSSFSGVAADTALEDPIRKAAASSATGRQNLTTKSAAAAQAVSDLMKNTVTDTAADALQSFLLGTTRAGSGAATVTDTLGDWADYGVNQLRKALGLDYTETDFSEDRGLTSMMQQAGFLDEDVTTESLYEKQNEWASELREGKGTVGTAIMDMADSIGNMMWNQAAGLSAMAVSAGGAAIQDAYDAGATPAEALANGIGNAGMEVLSEKLFGGNPLTDDDAGLINKLVGKITDNPTIMNLLTSSGMETLGEGLEEVIAAAGEYVVEKATYNEDAELSTEELLNSFVQGVALSLILSGAQRVITGSDSSATLPTADELEQDTVREGTSGGAGSTETSTAAAAQTAAVQQAAAGTAEAVQAEQAAGATESGVQTAAAQAQQQRAQQATEEAAAQSVNANQAPELAQAAAAQTAQQAARIQTAANAEGTENRATAATEAQQAAETESAEEGGTTLERTYSAGAADNRTGAAAGSTDSAAGRADVVSGGDTERASVADPGRQAGRVDAGAVNQTEQRRGYAEQSRTASQRRNSVIALQLDRTSSRALGIMEGTDTAQNTVIPEAAYDAELTEVAEKVQESTGITPTFVIGKLEVQTASGAALVNGAATASRIIVQADNSRYSATQLAEHEAWHVLAASDPDLNDLAMYAIQERFTPESFSEILGVYMDELRGVYPAEELAQRALEELLANAYAGINQYQTNTAQFQEAVRQQLTEGLEELNQSFPKQNTQQAAAEVQQEGTGQSWAAARSETGDAAEQAELDAQAMAAENAGRRAEETAAAEPEADYLPTVDDYMDGIPQNEAPASWDDRDDFIPDYLPTAEDDYQADYEDDYQEGYQADYGEEWETAAAAAEETDGFSMPGYIDLPAEVEQYVLQEKQRLMNRLVNYSVDGDIVTADQAAVQAFVDDLLNRAALFTVLDEETLWNDAADLWETAETIDESGHSVSAEYYLNSTGETGEAWMQHFVNEAQQAARAVAEAAESGRVPESSRWSTAEEAEDDTRRGMLPKSVQKQVRRLERAFSQETAEQLGWPAAYKREFLNDTAQQLTESWLQDAAGPGQETLDAIFDEAYSEGRVIQESEEYEALKDAKARMRESRIYVPDDIKRGITDWNIWRKRAFGKLRIVNKFTGINGIDQLYQELNSLYPWLYPLADSPAEDQLQQMLEVAEMPLQEELTLDKYASQFGGARAVEEARAGSYETFMERVETFGQEVSKIRRSTDWAKLEYQREQARQRQAVEQMEGEAIGAGIRAIEAQEAADAARQQAEAAQQAAEQAREEALRKQAAANAAGAALQGETRQPINLGLLVPEKAVEAFGSTASETTPAMSVEDVEELAQMNRGREVQPLDEEAAAQEYAARESWPTAGADAYEAYREGRAKAAEQRRLQNLDRDSFHGTAAMDALGIRISGSEADYWGVDSLRGVSSTAKAIDRQIDRLIKQHTIDAHEQQFASQVAAGFWSEQQAAALFPDPLALDRVLDLADLYALKAAVGQEMIAARKTDINQRIETTYDEMLQDVDEIADDERLLVQNYRTPERNLMHIFGDELGRKVYEYTFKPAQQNEAERQRWVTSMFDRVRMFDGKDGQAKKLSKAESAAVQVVIEGKAAREEVGTMSRAEEIQDAAARIVAKQDPDAVFREMALRSKEQQLASRLARLDDVYRQAEAGKIDMVRVTNAVNEYTAIFDQLYEGINDFLIAHGFEEIGYIKGYAPHLQPDSTQDTLHKVFQAIGVNADVTTLPTEIAGLTESYKPGKNWNPYFLSRNTDVTQYDIQAAFESYVDYMSGVFFHTDDLSRVRGLSNWFRKSYSTSEVKNLIEWAQGLRGSDSSTKLEFLRKWGTVDETSVLSAAEIDRQLASFVQDKYSKIEKPTKFGNLVQWLDNYANVLARKQITFDRATESFAGRKMLNAGNKLVQVFSRAQVAGNLSSALNQTSQLPLIAAELGPVYTARAVADFANGNARNEFVQQSDFLTGKAGIDYLTTSAADQALSVLFKPAEFMDSLMATIAVRGKYLQQIDAGDSQRTALRKADEFGRAVMGSRMKTERPLAFEAKNPVMAMLNVFQVEALNTWEHVSQDLPREYRAIEAEKGKTAAAKSLAGTLIAALLGNFILNRISEEVYGGSPAAGDLLGITANFFASGVGLTTNAWLQTIIDNGWEAVFGERLFDTDEDQALTMFGTDDFDWSAAASDTAYNITGDVPMLRNALGLLGLADSNMPISDISTLYDLGQTVASYFMGGEDAATGRDILVDAAAVASEFVPAGRQIEKTITGAFVATDEGSYKGSGPDGENAKLEYPVTDPVSKIQAALFGKYATSESSAYYAAGGEALSTRETAAYQAMVEAGSDSDAVFEAISDAAAADGDSGIAWAIAGSELEEAERQELLQLLLSDSAVEKAAAAFEAGMTVEDYAEALEALELAKEETGESLSTAETVAAIAQTGLEEEQKQALIAEYLSEAQAANAAAAYEAGASTEDVAALLQEMEAIKAETGKSSLTAAETAAAVAATGAGEEAQVAMLLAWLSESQAEKAAAVLEAGASVEDYAEVLEAVAGAEDKLEGYQAIIDGLETDEQQLAALCGQLGDTAALKLQTASDYGITAETYVEYLEALERYDDGNGRYTQEEAQKAIQSISGLTSTEQAVLWQMTGGNWKTDNSPYSTTAAENYEKALSKAKAAAEEEEEEEEEDESLSIWQAAYLPTA